MIITFNEGQILAAAQQCLDYCKAATVLAFHGEMGAGKTTFIKALCTVMDVSDRVSSPTFSIINEYNYKNKNGLTQRLYHLDLYRLKDTEEAVRAGVEDCIYSGDICFIEWPEIIISLLPLGAIHLYLGVLSDQTRSLRIVK